MRTKNWLVDARRPCRRHDHNRHVKKRKSENEKKNDRNPNMETATNPELKSCGSGRNVIDSGLSVDIS